MALDRRIAVLEAKKAPHEGPVEIWWLSPTAQEDLERGWQRAIRNYYDPKRNLWDSEEVRIDAELYGRLGQIELVTTGM